MLHPQERHYLLEALRPPEGKTVDYVVGTTFTLDLLALLTVPLSFTFFDFEERNGAPVRDPIPVMEALRRNAGKIAIFAQAGRTKVPTGNRLLNVFIEQSVHMVTPPSGGVFHPKLWAIRFLDEDNRVSYRVLCLSRNLTYDRSWDTVLCLEGDVLDRSNAIAANHPLGELFESLPGLATTPIPEATREKVDLIQRELRRTRFEAPDGMSGPWFWNFGIGNTRKNPLFEEARSLTVISPFLSAAFLEKAIEYKREAYLVSRRDSLDALPLPLLERFKEVYFFDSAVETEMQSGEENGEGGTDAPDTLYGLHAKLYILESDRDADVYTGSANATHAAFSTNVEFLTQLGGTIYKHGARSLFGDGEEAGALKKLLCRYERKGEITEADSFEASFEAARAQTVSFLCAAELRIECTEDVTGGFTLNLVFGEATGALPDGVQLFCRPASLSDFALQEVTAASRGIEFRHASFKAITSFFIFELRYAQDGHEKGDSFVLNLPLQGAPADRTSRVVSEFIQDKDNFLRLLMLILGLMDPTQGFGLEGDGDAVNGTSWFGGSSKPLFELLVRAVSRHPEKIDEIAGIITHLLKSEQGQSTLPEGFLEIWDPILQARQELHT